MPTVVTAPVRLASYVGGATYGDSFWSLFGWCVAPGTPLPYGTRVCADTTFPFFQTPCPPPFGINPTFTENRMMVNPEDWWYGPTPSNVSPYLGDEACYNNAIFEIPVSSWTANCYYELGFHNPPSNGPNPSGRFTWTGWNTTPLAVNRIWHCGVPNALHPVHGGMVAKGCQSEKPNFESGEYRCWFCPPAPANNPWTYDPVSHICYKGAPCPSGTFWCNATQECMPYEYPPCFMQRNCEWDPDACGFVCDDFELCGPDERFDLDTCSCVSCGEGNCWCEATQTCVPCEPPLCAAALNCEWNTNTCQWECDDPDAVCDDDEVFYFSENPDCCGCQPICPPGYCFCEGAEGGYGGCVPCPPPVCSDARGCYWDVCSCEYVCEDELGECPPGYEFDEEKCKCIPKGARPFNMQVAPGYYHQAFSSEDGIKYQFHDKPWPPRAAAGETWTVDSLATTNAEDAFPHMVTESSISERIRLFFTRDGKILTTKSADYGKTFLPFEGEEEPESPDDGEENEYGMELFPDGLVSTSCLTGIGDIIVWAIEESGLVKRRMLQAGSLDFDDEITCQVVEEADLEEEEPPMVDMTLDLEGFSVLEMMEISDRLMMVATKDGIKNYWSGDNGKTWRAAEPPPPPPPPEEP